RKIRRASEIYLNPKLETLSSLAKKYRANIYPSVDELLKSQDGHEMDGAIICTPHSTHFNIAVQLIQEGKRRFDESSQAGHRPMNILIEKPITTNVGQARELHRLILERSEAEKCASAGLIGGGVGCFQINHSANFRPQAKAAREIVESGKLGEIQHVSASFSSPLSWIFDDPAMVPWNEPDPKDSEMLGNGFAWGQQSHLVSWIYHVVGKDLEPDRVFCGMTHSEKTGADVSHSSTVLCKNGAVLSLSGTSLLPGNAHSDPPVGKRVEIKIYGSKGSLVYAGDDQDSSSGKLEWLRGEDEDENKIGAAEVLCPNLGFEFEELEQDGDGTRSLQAMIRSCLGEEYYAGADSLVGLRSVQIIDAMYRSHASGNCEYVR
ncbi:hypothetical protein THAOC_36102, partial [Thalassiosira oceanica]